ncbi:MAG: amidohydrolase [Armatimonadota bacterium]|nr:amidohydrolase [Armatimonadota bacterium]
MIYKAKHVLPITSEPVDNGEILVRDDRIEAVGPGLALSYPTEPIHDFGEAILMPGLVNTHTHLDYTILRGAIDDLPLLPWIRKITEYALMMQPEQFRWSAFLGAAELIQAGITTIADASFSGKALDAVLESGLRGIVYQEVFGYQTEDFSEELDTLKAQIDELAPSATSKARIGVSPHSIYTVSAGLLTAVREYAHKQGLPISIHVAESEAERDFCAKGEGDIARMYKQYGMEWACPGVSPVQYLYDLGLLGEKTIAAHCVHVDEDDVRLLAATRTGVAHCPKSNSKLGVGVAPLPAMLNAGIRLGLGSDSAVSSNTLDIFDEIRFAILLQRANKCSPAIFGAKSMVEAATIGGARALSMEKEIGSIQPGKKADLVAVDVSKAKSFPDRDSYTLLAYCASPSDVLMTMVDGEVLYDRPNLKSLDLAEIKQNAGEGS